jgi:hypothetical protein
MGKKILKSTLLATIVMAVLCAGTVSARQLQSEAKGIACGGTCSATHPCATGCFCSFTTPFTAFCTVRPAGVAPVRK